ncbi:adenosylcobinamide-phosphate synthase CbiB [Rhodospirillum rubrum]|uniref:Cobalamin biosynthesis protein CobD n=1 Tax=Rhodospirillum rubrum (strain ATCC 11170 / ATH 1.1.1 / DSM 467 / LMG 4362 / NCIMB 8255 / S1) TaxID=269796 RepID=Q2RNW9_RHORT|nr:adenosylcobinamide-phosphate synthase CbiB [Rhodospirillum rubrum]ABC24176.1 adenosylcobinamide-phosphate synthase [Rhodospirillum rubrum ATCC 11170]AEO49927.1 adenosylcobinamide-phosphate synthase [Rhodospirillum rubrum F11]MBK5955889.1 adenosylcobinamide-phosphate synthase [Rhodospirillum rubrum]QXG80113.1 adenosylcobinamide-phosphate synthase CbiB [Rhodospirillum rubrum]HCF18929.1 cobalamin biosynthesis protein CobD [Rhodospirillum rubrum]
MVSLFSVAPMGLTDPLVLVLLALVFDAYLGGMGPLFRLIPHPVVVMGGAIDALEQRLNRAERDDATRKRRGVFTVIVLVGAAIGLGVALQALASVLAVGWVLELLLAVALLAQRELHDHVAAVADGLETGGIDAGREAVSHIVGRDPALLDHAGVGRGALESLAENFSDGVVAPVFWFVLFGLPGLLAYKMINTMDSMIGHRTPRLRAFGWAAARLDDGVNLIPARLSGLLLIAAALTKPWADARAAFVVMLRDAGKHRSPNAGWPEGAMAGALGLRLSGPRVYKGEAPRDEPYVGDGRAGVTPKDIRRGLALFRSACLIEGALIALLAIALAVLR